MAGESSKSVPIDVVILTTAAYAVKTPQDAEGHAGLAVRGDELVVSALRRLGLSARRAGWDDPDFDWTSSRLTVIRTIWNYPEHFHDFMKWLDVTSGLTTILNAPALVKWNIDKHYLREMEDWGINVLETRYLEAGALASSGRSLSSWVEHELHWDDFVVKPCVSAGARATLRLRAGAVPCEADAMFAKMNAIEALMVQPYQHGITDGEISIMVIDGEVTHSVLKRPKSGDFRIQHQFGGVDLEHEPSEEETQFAVKCVQSLRERFGLPLITRVDFLRDNGGAYALVELELIEPHLWLDSHPEAVDTIAKGISRRLLELR